MRAAILALPVFFLPMFSLPVLGLLAAPGASLAKALPDGVTQGFELSGEYSLMVDGKPVPAAEIYLSPVPSILLLTSAFSSPVLLSPRSGKVDQVNLMKVSREKDGSLDLFPDFVLRAAGSFQRKDDGTISFPVEGKTVELVPKPPLLGPRTNEALKAYLPEYVRGARRYAPNAASIASLRKQRAPVTVRVFFGSWCPHCRQLVPSLLRVQDEVRNPHIRFEYYGIPQGLNDPEAKKAGVASVPTGIVLVGGKEVGRILTDGWGAPEVTLDKILNPAKVDPAKVKPARK